MQSHFLSWLDTFRRKREDDFNTLPEDDIIARCAFNSIVTKATRGASKLDRIYVSEPLYANIKVVSSTVKSDHMAVIAYSGANMTTINKRRERRVYRRRSPNQHATLFLEHIAELKLEFNNTNDVQTNFDNMYAVLLALLDRFYPERSVTVTSTDPDFVTPAIKAQLRRKNRLMRSGRVEEAGALAKRVQASIIRHNTAELRRVDTRHCAKDAWAKVRKLTKARDKSYFQEETNLTAQILNDHYAAVSTDQCYQPPQAKLSASQSPTHVTELQVFRMLDKLRPTATGLDSLPAWFLRLGAPVFCAPLAQLFNQSINSGVVPRQWKKAIITPIPKIQHPTQPNEYRPISITSALSRSLERRIVRAYIYPAILQPPAHLYFADQFAFRPTGSTVAALITLIHTVTTMLSDGPYVHVFSLDFSKAFDTVRHATLMEKLSTLAVPDEVYNWIKDFLDGHSHCTKFGLDVSPFADIMASVIQGSSLGPAAYAVTASDLRPIHTGNDIVKFADDTYLIIPASNTDTRAEELTHVQTWASRNNLQLNCKKSQEIIFQSTQKKPLQIPPPCPGIARVNSLSALGVIINNRLTAADHVSATLSSCSSMMYALRVLRDHGMRPSSLHDVYRATVLAKILYCSSAWSGLTSASDRCRIDAFLKKSKRLGYCDANTPPVADLFATADDALFKRMLANQHHVLQPLLPDQSRHNYNLRNRRHQLQLTQKTTHFNNKLFIIRSLFKDTY